MKIELTEGERRKLLSLVKKEDQAVKRSNRPTLRALETMINLERKLTIKR